MVSRSEVEQGLFTSVRPTSTTTSASLLSALFVVDIASSLMWGRLVVNDLRKRYRYRVINQDDTTLTQNKSQTGHSFTVNHPQDPRSRDLDRMAGGNAHRRCKCGGKNCRCLSFPRLVLLVPVRCTSFLRRYPDYMYILLNERFLAELNSCCILLEQWIPLRSWGIYVHTS